MHSPTEDKSDDTKDGHYDELDRVTDQFPKYHRIFFFFFFLASPL
jgi:hypothetical protein